MIYHLFDIWLQGAPYAYKSVLFRSTVAILMSFFFVLWLAPRVIAHLRRLKIGDKPEFDHEEMNKRMAAKAGVPTMGGALIIVAIIIVTLLLADLTNYYIRLGLFCAVWLTLLGGVDDWIKLTRRGDQKSRDGLKTYQKLLFQVGLGVLLGYSVYRHGSINFAVVGNMPVETYRILTVPFYKHGIQLSGLAFMFATVLVTAGTSNAVNLTDGMDGLASGCVSLCGFAFMVLCSVAGQASTSLQLLLPHVPDSAELAIICGAITGSCLGFLWYNCYPASVFMGDTGSLPLGGIIGYVAIVIRQELMLLIVGGVFVMEALSVILQVGRYKLTRKRFFRMAPIHHHFLMAGWTESQTVIRFWLMAGVCAAFALATIKLR